MDTIRIATRKSPLALRQTEIVVDLLRAQHPQLGVEILPLSTEGDTRLAESLSEAGGKGLFIKALEVALAEARAEIAVHSMKDVPVQMPEGFMVGAVLPRAQPADAFVSNHYEHLAQLPFDARIGTSSLRRRCQLKHHYPNLRVEDLRGNVGTRLDKLDRDECSALILAAAGLERLGLEERIRYLLPPHISLPAIGQGAIGIECRTDDREVLAYLRPLNDLLSDQCLQAERAVSRTLGGSCTMPLAAHANYDGTQLVLKSLIGDANGLQVLQDERAGALEQSEQLGVAAGHALLEQGADALIASFQP